ncbi:DUF5017 domain-containing protein [Flavobacterium algicola]|uniref:DUF5017 domain-containing protein n=1 Tax=Flavobacterium algicola TaxID=556529 RepID=UPI001EFE3C15|nr:DUF5017 domain-containing protein [Flavobacterium algicola]MCG9793084.1 DUF5017 domain-containing protein [Flavobacterium algicola]
MKKIIYTIMILGIIVTSCSDIDVETPDFQASLGSLNYKVGDTVKFSITGKSDYAYFFSGELGKEYSKRSIYENEVNGEAEFSFNSNVTQGAAGVSNLSILVSNDFNSLYDKVNVEKATWIDITNKVALGTSTTNVVSGVVDLTSYQSPGKPLFIAYRYLGQNTATLKQQTWTVGLFSFKTKHADGEVYVNAASYYDASFTAVDLNGGDVNWSIGSSALTHVGVAAGNEDDNDWAISKAINLKIATGDAEGVETIRTLNTGFTPTEYSYVYNKAGTYKATMVAANATSEGRKEKISEFAIVVTE